MSNEPVLVLAAASVVVTAPGPVNTLNAGLVPLSVELTAVTVGGNIRSSNTLRLVLDTTLA